MQIRLRENQLEAVEGITVEYPYAYHNVNIREVRIPWHWHEELEIDYVFQGSVLVTTLEKNYRFSEGEAFFMNSNVLSSMSDVGTSPCIMRSHLFHQILLGGHFKSVYETKYMLPVLQDRKIEVVEIRGKNASQKQMLTLIRRLSDLQEKKDVEFQTRNILGEFWLLLLKEIQEQEFSRPKLSAVSQERIQDMLSFIHANYWQKISLEEIARSASVSRRECIRCFQECLRKTPFEYLLDYRVEEAEKLLKTTGLSVTEIALETGFSGAAYFGKVFREKKGRSPGAFRREIKKGSKNADTTGTLHERSHPSGEKSPGAYGGADRMRHCL